MLLGKQKVSVMDFSWSLIDLFCSYVFGIVFDNFSGHIRCYESIVVLSSIMKNNQTPLRKTFDSSILCGQRVSNYQIIGSVWEILTLKDIFYYKDCQTI